MPCGASPGLRLTALSDRKNARTGDQEERQQTNQPLPTRAADLSHANGETQLDVLADPPRFPQLATVRQVRSVDVFRMYYPRSTERRCAGVGEERRVDPYLIMDSSPESYFTHALKSRVGAPRPYAASCRARK